MWIVGEGELKEQVENLVSDYKLQDSVFLLGRHSDVSNLMQAMDILIVPSLYEGLSIVCIEAQAASLPVFSSEVIPKEADITNLITRISLDKSASDWADMIVTIYDGLPTRKSTLREIKSAGFDISEEAKKLQQTYISIIHEN